MNSITKRNTWKEMKNKKILIGLGVFTQSWNLILPSISLTQQGLSSLNSVGTEQNIPLTAPCLVPQTPF